MVERGRRVAAVEVKIRPKVGFRETAGLRRFLDEHPGAFGGLVVYSGNEILRLAEKIVAVPWPLLTGRVGGGAAAS